jgi:peptide/nickel transport system substrate-binding protein
VATTGTGYRRVAGIVAFVVGTAALAACSGAGSSNAGSSLRYGYDLSAQFTNTFDVSKSTGDCDQIPLFYIYDTLLHIDPATNQPTGGLAESYALDGRTLTLKLRPGVKFTDGTPVDGDAVKQGLERNNKNDQLTTLDIIDSIDVPDPQTVVIHLTDDTGIQLVYGLTSRDGMVMAPSTVKSAGTKPVGAGPFKFDSFTPGSTIKLVRNPDYWQQGVYDFPGITYTQTATGPPAVSALKAGDVDLIRFEADSLKTLKGDAAMQVVSQPTEAYLQFQFRTKEGSPFTNPLVRQAVRYAIDTKQINEIVQAGQGEVATQSLPKASPGYNPDVAGAYPYNPDKARELLAQAGLPNGFEFTMVIPGGNIANMEQQGALIQDQLKKVGITAKIQRILGTDIATQYYIAGKGDAFAAAHLRNKFYPGVYYDQWGKFQFVPIWNGAERDDIDRLMIDAQSTPDPARIAQDTKDAAKIVSDEALEVPIAFMPQFMAYDKARVGGTVKAQTDICDPPDLTGLRMKAKG